MDLGSYESVKQFCERAGKLERLDVVCENAGVATPTFELVEGIESTITVNVIATFLMALLMIPHLRASALKYNIVPRLTIVASDAHEAVTLLSLSHECNGRSQILQAKFREATAPSIFEALRSPKYQSDRYNVSKLLEILVVRQLAPLLTSSPRPNVVLNTLTPGFCHSELMRHAVFPLNVLAWIGKMTIGRTTEAGSRTLVEAAAAGEETHGVYMTDCKPGEVSRWVRSDDGVKAQKKVFDELMQILDTIEPGITKDI